MFSDREQKVIKILGKKSMTFKTIAIHLFKDKMPLDPTILVCNSVNRIILKCKHHKLDWTLAKNRSGGMAMTVTKEKR